MIRFLSTIGFAVLLMPLQAFAYNNWGVDVEFISLFDIFFDILSFSVGVVAFGLGFQVLNKLGSGLKKAWIYFMTAIIIFIVLQLLSLLSLLQIVDLSSVFSILKFFMALSIMIGVLQSRSFYNRILLSKASKNNELKDLENVATLNDQ